MHFFLKTTLFHIVLLALFLIINKNKVYSENLNLVVVELFTSQGCSSCPPADEGFSSWGREFFEKNIAIPLSFHVDYWNYLGWKDPFSQAVFSARQKKYASVMNLKNIYTPQLVINGQEEMVGTHFSSAIKFIQKQSKKKSPVVLNVKAKLNEPVIETNISIQPQSKNNFESMDLMVVIFENNLITQIHRGENKGLRLVNNFVVRYIENLGSIDLTKPSIQKNNLQWQNHWIKKNIGIVVFLQKNHSQEIISSAKFFPLQ